MAEILDGKEVAAVLNEKLRVDTERLKARGITPALAIIRVGERGDDIAYEKAAKKRCEKVGVTVRNIILSEQTTQEELLAVIGGVNSDSSVHGVLLFRPLPKHMDDAFVRNALNPAKDIDGITDASLAGVFASTGSGFPPCTPQACMEILDHFNIDVAGKSAVVVGRSLVVGKPVAMMLLQRNATVTICHTKTADLPAVCRSADILIAAVGKAGIIGGEYLRHGQLVIDVGINVDENNRLQGDVNFDEASIVRAITPVPGGVGTVTTSVLVKHVVEAAAGDMALSLEHKEIS